ncbi:rhodanese-like domain-containing protein [Pontivivens ytuae]|uniref:Rhodanese-like domain-containing protein n=1 Tax=Pontivivens ytuae TaxID=2789856 RepID=A0A7S9LT06_9RHOB|nr:rhodanese-like domain-containing protein [Pontivivens ytuae]QPH54460.1 rhodanese-like domain-containing protein [Pontivivens ytuae]
MKTLSDMVAAAKAEVETITVAEAMEMHGRENVTFVDVREPPEVAQGRIAGAVPVPRGTLEFAIDGPSPNPAMADKGRTYVFYCAAGGRAAMAAATAKEMGYADAKVMETGFGNWKEAGGPEEGR